MPTTTDFVPTDAHTDLRERISQQLESLQMDSDVEAARTAGCVIAINFLRLIGEDKVADGFEHLVG